jgi:hypothetical protein
MDAMQELWQGAGLDDVGVQAIAVQRTFTDFEDYWATILGGPSVGPRVAALTPDGQTVLKARMRRRLAADTGAQITCSARANAVKGRVSSERYPRP